MSPMVVETLKLGIAILNGGNAGVQQVMGAPSGPCRPPGLFLTWHLAHFRGEVLPLLWREPPPHNHRYWCWPFVASYIRVAGHTDKTRLRVDRQMCA